MCMCVCAMVFLYVTHRPAAAAAVECIALDLASTSVTYSMLLSLLFMHSLMCIMKSLITFVSKHQVSEALVFFALYIQ